MKTHMVAIALLASLSFVACASNAEEPDEETSSSEDALTQSVELGRGPAYGFRMKSDYEFPQSAVQTARVSWNSDTTCGTLYACPLPNGGSPSSTYCKAVPSGGSRDVTGAFQLNLMSERNGAPCYAGGGNSHGYATITTNAPSSSPPVPSSECPSGRALTVTKDTIIDHVVNARDLTFGVVNLEAIASSPYYRPGSCCSPSTPYVEFKICTDDRCTHSMGTDEFYAHREWQKRAVGFWNTPRASTMTLVASSLTNKPVKMCVRNVRQAL